MPLSEKFTPLDESDAVKNTDSKPKKEYVPFVSKDKESLDEPSYTIEQTFRNITVNFGDFRLSMDNGTERDENWEITSDGKPCIIHSDEWLMYPEDIQKMELPESPYKPTGNSLADAFLKTLNFYLTSFYGKQIQLTDEEIKNIVWQADIRTKSNI